MVKTCIKKVELAEGRAVGPKGFWSPSLCWSPVPVGELPAPLTSVWHCGSYLVNGPTTCPVPLLLVREESVLSSVDKLVTFPGKLKGVHTKYMPIFHVSQLFLPGRFLFVCLFFSSRRRKVYADMNLLCWGQGVVLDHWLHGLPVGRCLLQVKWMSCRLPVLERSLEELMCKISTNPCFQCAWTVCFLY